MGLVSFALEFQTNEILYSVRVIMPFTFDTVPKASVSPH